MAHPIEHSFPQFRQRIQLVCTNFVEQTRVWFKMVKEIILQIFCQKVPEINKFYSEIAIYIYTRIQYLKSACTSNVKLHFLNMLFFLFLLCSQAAAPFPMWANINKLVLYTYRTIFTLLYVKSVHMNEKYLKNRWLVSKNIHACMKSVASLMKKKHILCSNIWWWHFKFVNPLAVMIGPDVHCLFPKYCNLEHFRVQKRRFSVTNTDL